jgi:hypothetical protein
MKYLLIAALAVSATLMMMHTTKAEAKGGATCWVLHTCKGD